MSKGEKTMKGSDIDNFSLAKTRAREIVKLLSELSERNQKTNVGLIREYALELVATVDNFGDITSEEVNWVYEWPPFVFDDCRTVDQVKARKAEVEAYLREWLAAEDLAKNTNHRIDEIVWQEILPQPLTYRLAVYLDPPALLNRLSRVISDGSLSPKSPPPPGFGS